MNGPRGAVPKEIGEIVELVDRIFRPNSPSSMGQEFPLLFAERNAENLRVIEADGKIVSHVGLWMGKLSLFGSEVTSGSLGAVCTDPGYRGKGLATKLVEDAINRAIRQGAGVLFVSGERDLYRRAGCVPAGMNWIYSFSPADPLEGEERVFLRSMESISSSRLYPLLEILQAEPVRYRRTLGEFVELLRADPCGAALNWTSRLISLSPEENSRATAYLYLRTKEEEGKLEGVIREYAGDRTLLASALPALFDKYGLHRLRWEVPNWDFPLKVQLERMKSPAVEPVLGTLKVLDFPGLMEELRPYWERRLERKEAAEVRFGVRSGGGKDYLKTKEASFSFEKRSDLTRFLFGHPKDKGEELPRVLQKILPLPLPNPGCLNYI